jgi:hypothetical protein
MSRLKTLVVAGAAVAATACSDFLSGDKLDFDPNRPTSAEAAQLLTAVQVNSYYILNGHAARVLAMWMQQMAGTDRQYRGYDQYSITEGLFGEYSSAYTGGGLIDMRAIQADAELSGNKTLGGIAKVWEALVMGFVADMYGDATYSEAVDGDNHPQPILDGQLEIYAALQTLLDGAIADLSSGQGSVGDLDLSLGGDADAWVHVANTLKARLYLHTAEVNPSAYASALSALCTGATLASCTKGIQSSAGDLNEYHSSASGEENIWWQFIARDRDSYMRPGKHLVDLMNSRSDPRRPEYLQLNGSGVYGGAAPGEGLSNAISNLGLTRLDPDYDVQRDVGDHRRSGLSHEQHRARAGGPGCVTGRIRGCPRRCRALGECSAVADPRGEVRSAVPELRGVQRLETHVLSQPHAGDTGVPGEYPCALYVSGRGTELQSGQHPGRRSPASPECERSGDRDVG